MWSPPPNLVPLWFCWSKMINLQKRKFIYSLLLQIIGFNPLTNMFSFSYRFYISFWNWWSKSSLISKLYTKTTTTKTNIIFGSFWQCKLLHNLRPMRSTTNQFQKQTQNPNNWKKTSCQKYWIQNLTIKQHNDLLANFKMWHMHFWLGIPN